MPLEPPDQPIGRSNRFNRQFPARHALVWLEKGWHDFKSDSLEASLLYGVAVTIVSILIVVALFSIHFDFVLLPAVAAFLLFGPALAMGLYQKSRLLEIPQRAGILDMLKSRPGSRGHVAFVGLVLMLLIGLWLRSGVLLYALFFGLRDFTGTSGFVLNLFTEPAGWLLLITGTLFGGLFAALALAISTFSVPMLLNERTDAFSAMGVSVALSWHNVPVMFAWGMIVTGLFVLSLLTGLLGLIVIFPVLGHATWHAYRDIRGDVEQPVFSAAITDLPATPLSGKK